MFPQKADTNSIENHAAGSRAPRQRREGNFESWVTQCFEVRKIRNKKVGWKPGQHDVPQTKLGEKLIVFSMLYFTSPQLSCNYQFVHFNPFPFHPAPNTRPAPRL